jgi:uncharacterized membrane protein YeaQ/YmgE (transglycosylase-associated protein family)
MTLVGLLILIGVAAVCGFVGQLLAGYSLGGLVISVLVGFVGAWIGWWIARNWDLPAFYTITVDGKTFPIVWSIIGSAIFAAVIGLVARPRYV